MAPEISDQLEPLFVLICHLTEGVGLPEAAAVKVAVWPTSRPMLTGCCVTVGADVPEFTVTVAAFVVAAEPMPLL